MAGVRVVNEWREGGWKRRGGSEAHVKSKRAEWLGLWVPPWRGREGGGGGGGGR